MGGGGGGIFKTTDKIAENYWGKPWKKAKED